MLDIIGYIAAFCTTTAFIPQAAKVYRNKRTKDISIGMFLLLTVGISLWLVYGLILMALPIILANGVTLIFALYILIMKIKLDYLHKPIEA
jgi:MtN3 and saliva related transmembrane protein